jgi:hypothetical protein
MAKVKKFELEDPVPILDDEDAETLAAIDEGIRDAEAGRTVPSEEVRKLLPKWISASSTKTYLSCHSERAFAPLTNASRRTAITFRYS